MKLSPILELTYLFENVMTSISVILVSYNTLEMTKVALKLLLESINPFKMDIFIIDNNSNDQSAEMIRNEFPEITLIENKKNVGFGRANNQALPLIKTDFVLLLNTDAFVEKDTIRETVQYMDTHPTCGILGVKLIGRDGSLQPSCRYFPTPLNIFINRCGVTKYFKSARMVDDMSWDHNSIRDCDWVPGCYYLIRKEVIDQVGLFDSRYFLYYEEVDHCFAAKKAGWKVTYFSNSSVVHLGGESAKQVGALTAKGQQLATLQIESELLFFRKNYGIPTVLIHLFLDGLADLVQLAKDIIRLRSFRIILSNTQRVFMTWQIFLRTKFAQQPTR